MPATIIGSEGFEDSAVFLMAREAAGALITPADISSIAYNDFNSAGSEKSGMKIRVSAVHSAPDHSVNSARLSCCIERS